MKELRYIEWYSYGFAGDDKPLLRFGRDNKDGTVHINRHHPHPYRMWRVAKLCRDFCRAGLAHTMPRYNGWLWKRD